jgi:hypothetical protein
MLPLKIGVYASFELFLASDSSASSNPSDKMFYESRAKHLASICSNTVKIKSASFKMSFITKT